MVGIGRKSLSDLALERGIVKGCADLDLATEEEVGRRLPELGRWQGGFCSKALRGPPIGVVCTRGAAQRIILAQG